MNKRVSTLVSALLIATTLGLQQPIANVINASASTRTVRLVKSRKSARKAPKKAAKKAKPVKSAKTSAVKQPAGTGKRIAMQDPNAANVRDLGGYVNKFGQRIKFHRLLRSNTLATITKADQKKLVQVYHLGTDVDLRTIQEQTQQPDKRMKGVKYVPDSVFLKWGKASGDLPDTQKNAGVKNMETFYRNAVLGTQGRKAYRKLFTILLTNPSNKAVLWHCSAGKDRAGMGTMLVLSALNFDRQTINHDYLLSNTYLKQIIAGKVKAAEAAHDSKIEIANIKAGAGVQMAFLNTAYKAIDQKYGSVHKYLLSKQGLGLTSHDLTELQKNYLTPAKK